MSVASIPANAARRAGRISPAVRIASAVVLALLVACVGVFAYLQAAKVSDDQARQQRDAAALAAAKTEIAQVLSYDYRHLRADLAKATAATTGDFHGQFTVLAAQAISPLAVQQKTVTKAVVPKAAVLDDNGSQVSVLVFVAQATTNTASKTPQRSGGQIRLTMQNVNGHWLIEEFKAY